MASAGRVAGAEPVAMIACLKRIFWGSSPSTRSPRESSKTARPPVTSTPRSRSPITMSQLQQQLVRTLEQADDVGGEARAVGAVGDAMVEGKRQGKHQPRHDLAVANHGFLAPAGHAQDGDLRVVDD